MCYSHPSRPNPFHSSIPCTLSRSYLKMMKPNRQGGIRSLRGKMGTSSSSGVDKREPEKEVYGEQTGRISPSPHDHGDMNKKLIHKNFFNSFQGQLYYTLLFICSTVFIFISSTLLSIVISCIYSNFSSSLFLTQTTSMTRILVYLVIVDVYRI